MFCLAFARVCRTMIMPAYRCLNTAAVQMRYSVNHNIGPRIISFKNGCFARLYSENIETPATVDYDYVKKATNNNNVLIVDVREPEEIKELGKIPNSINIPLGIVPPTVLTEMSDKEFQKMFNRQKPNENTEVIFYCMIGGRSGKAQKAAINAGYKNIFGASIVPNVKLFEPRIKNKSEIQKIFSEHVKLSFDVIAPKMLEKV